MAQYELGYCITEKALFEGFRTQEQIDKNSCHYSCDECRLFGFRGFEGKEAHDEYDRHLKDKK